MRIFLRRQAHLHFGSRFLPGKAFQASLCSLAGLVSIFLMLDLPLKGETIRFVDITESSGIDFFHHSSPEKKHIVEAMSGGVALFDFDNDGWLDIFFVNSLTVETAGAPERAPSGLYRNNRDGTFTDVTDKAGVALNGWGMGTVVADYNGDGWLDLYVTCLGPNKLYRNNGDGTFTEVGAAAGVDDRRWSTGATFGDYDRDGDLDLFVANYTDATLENLDRFGEKAHCNYRGIPIQCDPRVYDGAGDSLYRNNGDGIFTEVSREAGVSDPDRYYGLGATWVDVDEDGWPDLYVANDERPCFLYRNLGNGHFQDEGFLSGAAVAEEGTETGSMGIALGDYDRDGRLDIYVTNFAYEYNSLYRQDSEFLFIDMSIASRTGDASVNLVGWGTEFFDYNNDGWLDLIAANGHLYPQVEELPGVGQRITAFGLAVQAGYRQPKSLFRNRGDGTFSNASEEVGAALTEPRVSRGLAVGDLDNDGDLDVVVNDLDGPPMVLRNDGGNEAGNWLRIRLEGAAPNRFAVGAPRPSCHWGDFPKALRARREQLPLAK
jgi:enediyne biosynthesis protein E4